MTKEQYLNELSDLLDLNDFSKEEKLSIILKYRKRYEFGLESEMTDEEIINMLGTPADVINKYVKIEVKDSKEQKKFVNEEKANYKKGYNLKIKTVSDDIVMLESEDDECHLEFDGVDLTMYNIVNNTEEGVKVDYIKSKFFGLNRRKGGVITVRVPNDKVFDEAELSSVSGDISSTLIKANKLNVATTSGDVNLIDAQSNEEVHINTVSGDSLVHLVKGTRLALNTVSGDARITKAIVNKISINTVSGDVSVDESTTDDVNASSITGDIYISGREFKSLSKSIRG
ncbi:MAG: DUF4097 family beta strand repeat-containing protein [Gammaproteobacteria bacterium]|nr:DUF4097 family beta strand repeat-containing protein [Gammaproteobacteria bacterium]